MDGALQDLGNAIAAALPGAVRASTVLLGELTLDVAPAGLLETARYLRDDPYCLFVSFVDLTAVDYPPRVPRFDVVIHLLSPHHNHRVRVKVAIDEDQPIDSLCAVYPAANWFERETYDLFGIVFSGHPDLRRILTDYGFEGHPMRKDFPMTGYVEVRYDDAQKRVINEPVRLRQEFRTFDFLSPWEGGNSQYVLPGDEKAGPQGEQR